MELKGRHGSWELPQFHQWKDRGSAYLATKRPTVAPSTRVATIGSCFAEELARGMQRLGIAGAMHPTGLFYNTASIRQEIERVFGGWKEAQAEPMWQTKDGWIHPFKDANRTFETEEKARRWSAELDAEAEELFRNADVIVITLGLIEIWRSQQTGNVFRVLPHPQTFREISPKFERLTVAQMASDLDQIYRTIRANSRAEIVVTVSPVPLHATMTASDVRVANSESKSRIRAVVSEFCEAHPDVRYFHSYELVMTAERMSDFMEADGRHVQRRAVDYILAEFVRTFGDGLAAPQVDTSWISTPTKTAAKPTPKLIERVVKVVPQPLRQAVLDRIPPEARQSLRDVVRRIKKM